MRETRNAALYSIFMRSTSTLASCKKDLLNIGDARCLEAADLIYEKMINGFRR